MMRFQAPCREAAAAGATTTVAGCIHPLAALSWLVLQSPLLFRTSVWFDFDAVVINKRCVSYVVYFCISMGIAKTAEYSYAGYAWPTLGSATNIT